MRKLAVLGALLVGFAAAYVVLDVAARGFVESRVEDEFRDGSRVQVVNRVLGEASGRHRR